MSEEEKIRRIQIVEYYVKRLKKIGWIFFAMLIVVDVIATFVYQLRLNVPVMNIYLACFSLFHLWKGYYLDKKSIRRWAMVGIFITILPIVLRILAISS